MQKLVINKREMPYDVNEAMKLLRTNLQFCGKDKKVIMITSTLGFQGSTSSSKRSSMAAVVLPLSPRFLMGTELYVSQLYMMQPGGTETVGQGRERLREIRNLKRGQRRHKEERKGEVIIRVRRSE